MRTNTRTLEERAQLLARYKASGLSAMAFSKEHGIPISTLYMWLLKERRAKPAIRMARVIRQAVVPSRGRGVSGAGLMIESGALRVHVPTGVDPATLETVLRVIASHSRTGEP